VVLWSEDTWWSISPFSYLEDELLDPGSLGQEVQHGESGVGPHGCHGDPVASAGARPDVVGEAGQVVHEGVHAAFVEPGHVDSGGSEGPEPGEGGATPQGGATPTRRSYPPHININID